MEPLGKAYLKHDSTDQAGDHNFYVLYLFGVAQFLIVSCNLKVYGSGLGVSGSTHTVYTS